MLCSSTERLPYARILDTRCVDRNEGLFFRCELKSTGALSLDAPDVSNDKRIYRVYGSDRFLEVRLPLSTGESRSMHAKRIKDFFISKVTLCGREYAYLWCKKEKTPQAYILFAERGGLKGTLNACSEDVDLNSHPSFRHWNRQRPGVHSCASSGVLHSSSFESGYHSCKVHKTHEIVVFYYNAFNCLASWELASAPEL